MACCFCGSSSHDRESCPWYGTGKRLVLAMMLCTAVGCAGQEQRAVEPRYYDDKQSEYVHAVMVECARAVMVATDAARAEGHEITQLMMQRAYERCLVDMQVTI